MALFDMFLFYDWPFFMRVFCRKSYYYHFIFIIFYQFLAHFSATVLSFMG